GQSDGEQRLLDQSKPPRLTGQSDKPFDAFGDEHQRVDLRSVLPPQFDHHGQGATRDEWEGVGGIYCDRRQHRKQPIHNRLAPPVPVVPAQRLLVENEDPVTLKQLLKIPPPALLSLSQPDRTSTDLGQLLPRGQSVIALNSNGTRRQLLQSGDTDHVE